MGNLFSHRVQKNFDAELEDLEAGPAKYEIECGKMERNCWWKDLKSGRVLSLLKLFGFSKKGHDEVPPLKVEEDEFFHTLFGGDCLEILVVHEPSNIRITRKVLQCLRPRAWLNDEVINLYLELLKERERREPEKFLKCHFFNTFFFKKLISGRDGYDFSAVRRWTRQEKLGYTLIECDKVFVPIHKDIHWCLVVINVKDETIQYLDSLGGMDTYVLEVLAFYFMDEARDKGVKEVDTLSWKRESVNDLPLQVNDWDCGMFMLTYINYYSRGWKLTFSQEDIAYFRIRTAKEIVKLTAE